MTSKKGSLFEMKVDRSQIHSASNVYLFLFLFFLFLVINKYNNTLRVRMDKIQEFDLGPKYDR